MEPETRVTKSVALGLLLVSALTILAPTVDASNDIIVVDDTLHPEDAEALAELINSNLILCAIDHLTILVEIEIHEDAYSYGDVTYVEMVEDGEHDLNYRVSYAAAEWLAEENDFCDYLDMDIWNTACLVAVVSCGQISNGTSWASNNLDLRFDNVRFLWETRECREIADIVGRTGALSSRILREDAVSRALEDMAFVIEQ